MTGLHGLNLGVPAPGGDPVADVLDAQEPGVDPVLPGALRVADGGAPPEPPQDIHPPLDPQAEIAALKATIAMYEAEHVANWAGGAVVTALYLDPDSLQQLKTTAAATRDRRKLAELPKVVLGFKANSLHVGE